MTKKKKNSDSQNTPKQNENKNSKSSKNVKAAKARRSGTQKPKPSTSLDSTDSVVSDIRYYSTEIWKLMKPITITRSSAFFITSLIVEDFKNAVKDINTRRLSQCYGSFRDGLYFNSNHIDLIYPLRSPNYIEDPIPRRVEQSLRQSSLFENVIYTVTNQVPIIRLVHFETQKHVEISFHKDSADIMNTKLMQYYVSLDPNLTYLILYLKYLLSKYKLHGANKITTTILFWLVVFFMQQKRSFPSMLELRRTAQKQCFVSGWDCSVPFYTLGESDTKSSGYLFSLLRNFFQFYKDCNFFTIVICPVVSRSISISQFKHLQLPYDGFSIYASKVRNGEIDCFPTSYMNLQDPTLLGNNLAKHSTENIITQFKILCHYAYENLTDFKRERYTQKKSLMEFLPINLYVGKDERLRNPNSKMNYDNPLETNTSVETFFTNRMQKRERKHNKNSSNEIETSSVVPTSKKRKHKHLCKRVECHSCNDYNSDYKPTRTLAKNKKTKVSRSVIPKRASSARKLIQNPLNLTVKLNQRKPKLITKSFILKKEHDGLKIKEPKTELRTCKQNLNSVGVQNLKDKNANREYALAKLKKQESESITRFFTSKKIKKTKFPSLFIRINS